MAGGNNSLKMQNTSASNINNNTAKTKQTPIQPPAATIPSSTSSSSINRTAQDRPSKQSQAAHRSVIALQHNENESDNANPRKKRKALQSPPATTDVTLPSSAPKSAKQNRIRPSRHSFRHQFFNSYFYAG